MRTLDVTNANEAEKLVIEAAKSIGCDYTPGSTKCEENKRYGLIKKTDDHAYFGIVEMVQRDKGFLVGIRSVGVRPDISNPPEYDSLTDMFYAKLGRA